MILSPSFFQQIYHSLLKCIRTTTLFTSTSFANCNRSPLQPLTQFPSRALCYNCILDFFLQAFLFLVHSIYQALSITSATIFEQQLMINSAISFFPLSFCFFAQIESSSHKQIPFPTVTSDTSSSSNLRLNV